VPSGADAIAVTNLFLRDATRVLAGGISVGVGAATALGGMLKSQLYGVGENDPATLSATAVVFAVWRPHGGRRAARLASIP